MRIVTAGHAEIALRFDRDIRHWLLGCCLELNGKTKRGRISLGSCLSYLDAPVSLGQIILLVSDNNIPVAYTTWAWVRPETLARILHEDPFLHVSEWRDGHILCVYDVVAPFGHAAPLLRSLRHYLWTASRERETAGFCVANRRRANCPPVTWFGTPRDSATKHA